MYTRFPIRLAAIIGACSIALTGVPGVTFAQSGRSPGTQPATRFWATLDSARAGAVGCEAISRRLEQRLRVMPTTDLEHFAQDWSDWWGRSYNWDLWGAAYLINGGASDDGFDYFRGWLLSEGSERWAKVSRNIESAFDDIQPGAVLECEDIIVTLPNVYEERFGREAADPGNHEPTGKVWTEESLPNRFPRLARRFARP